MIGRRHFLGRSAAALTTLALPRMTAAAEPGLGALAARSGRFFGSALPTSVLIEAEPTYRNILETECSVWVPEWQLKWGSLVRNPADSPDFTQADLLVEAALTSEKKVRGHTLLWHEALPPFVEALQDASDWDNVVVPHIRAVSEHYGDRIFQWDVVNEAIEPRDGGGDLMRRSVFYRLRGADYVAEAFRIASETAPSARLYLNDHFLCYNEGWQEKQRKGVLSLLERLLVAGAPVHGLGIQGHLDTRFAYSERVFARFLDEVRAMGLEIAITELDVREADKAGSLSLEARRRKAADEVRKVISVALDCDALAGIVTWGLSDRASWLRKTYDIPDNQGLPYDDACKPTPMRAVLAERLTGTGSHHAQ